MATQKEGTLAIKDFMGISRYFASPNQPPNKCHTLQNLYSPARGELAQIPGVTEQSAASEGFFELQFTYNLNGRKVILGTTTGDNILTPDINDFTFVAAGAGATATDIRVTYTMLGVEGPLSVFANPNRGASGLDVTLPSIPDEVAAVNFYIYDATSSFYVWAASIVRDRTTGTFPASCRISCLTPTAGTGGTSSDSFTTISFTPTTGGTLTPGKTYYFAFAPYVLQSPYNTRAVQPQVAQATAGGTIAAFTMPPGMTAISVTANLTGLYNGVNSYTNTVVFMGDTPEDLLACPHKTAGGVDLGQVVEPTTVADVTGDGVLILREPHETNLGFASEGTAAATRKGYFYLNHPLSSITWSSENVGFGYYFPEGTLEFVAPGSAGYTEQIAACRGSYYNSVDYFGSSDTFYIRRSSDRPIEGVILGDRLFFADGFQAPYYTNGRIIKPIAKDYQTADPPITKYVTSFSNRLVYGGGGTNFYNTKGLVYYTALTSGGAPNPFSFTATPSATPVRDFFSVQSTFGGDIQGLDVFAYNEATEGQAAQIIIGLQNAVWYSQDPTDGAKEVMKGVGFFSPHSFANTNAGAIFLGRDNVYLITQGGNSIPIGSDVAPIIQAIEVNDRLPLCYYHDGHFKIAYAPSETAYTKEIWLDLQPDFQGKPRMAWYGPHTMNEFTSVATFPVGEYDGIHKQDRVSGTYLTKVRQFCVPNIYWAAGEARACTVIFNDLILDAEDFIKILTQLYLRARITNDQYAIGVSFQMIDSTGLGSGDPTATNIGTYSTTSFTFTVLPASLGVSTSRFALFQKQFTERYRGTIIQNLTLTFGPPDEDSTINIYELAILFEQERRRLL